MCKSENFRLMAANTQKSLEARRSFRRFKRRRARRVVYARCTAHFSLRFGHYDCAPNVFWKTRMQRFFAYYCRGFSFAHYFQTRMQNAKDTDDARARIRDYFQKQADDVLLCLS